MSQERYAHLEQLFNRSCFKVDGGTILQGATTSEGDMEIEIYENERFTEYRFPAESIAAAKYDPGTGTYYIESDEGDICAVEFFDLVKRY